MRVRHTGKDGKAETKKVGRNNPCPCGSGKKFKYCHGPQTKRWTDQEKEKKRVEEKPREEEGVEEAEVEEGTDAEGPAGGSAEPEGD